MSPLSQFEASWPAISALLDEALSLPAPERASWLDGLIGEPASHREELRILLANQARIETDDFLNALPCLDTQDDTTRPPLGRLAMGSSVGAYRLIAEIGQGGMGTVWLAERADGMMNRRVALKLPHIVWGGSFAERLGREREILATLEHEHVARLYDAGIDAHGRPFLAMEYVDGQPIDAYCRTHALPVRERVALLLQVMAAVSHAHSRLIVHRDLKPSNILVTNDAKVKLLDFGIAKLLEGDSTLRTALTELTGRALTLDYASPEQIRGEPLGTGSDVYSLAVVAYEVLADARPYRLKRGTAAEMEEAIASSQPRQASEAATSPAARKALRGDLDAILNRALKKAVADRYPSVDALAQDLQRYLRGEPVQARPDGARYRAAKFVGRHRVAVAMVSALVVSVVAGSAISVWQAQEARAQERRAMSEVRRQSAVQDLYIETLSRLSLLGAEHPEALARPGAVTSVLQDKLREFAPRVADHPDEREAQLWATLLQLNYDHRFEESLAVGQEYLSHLKAHEGAPVLVIGAYIALGRTLFRLKRYDESEAMRRAGMNWAPDARDRDTELARMDAASDLGGLLTARGKRDEALVVLMRADTVMAQRYPEEHRRVFTAQKLAQFHLGFDDALALSYMRQSHAELLANGTADPDTAAFNDELLGGALLATGRAAEAESALSDALALYLRENGRDSPDAVRVFSRLVGAVARRDAVRAIAMIDEQQRTLPAATADLSRLVDSQLRALRLEAAWLTGDAAAAVGIASPDIATLIEPAFPRDTELLPIDIAHALVLSGRSSEALQLLRALQSSLPDGSLPNLPSLRIQEALAETQLAAGQPAAAGKTAAGLIELLEQQHATGGRAYRAAAALGALAAVNIGDRAEASRLLTRIQQQTPPGFPSGAERADCELRRAQALLELGRATEAAQVARGALAELTGQHPGSPRLALAKRLIASGAAK